MQGEGKRLSVWISLLIAGKHDGGYSIEGDGLRAEGEFFVLFGLCQEQLEKRVLETGLFSIFSTRANHEGGEVFTLCPGLNYEVSGLSPWQLLTGIFF